MKLARKQRGIGALNLLYILVSLAVFGLVALKLFPVYIEGMKIDNAISVVASEPGAADRTPKELAYSVVKRLDIDGVNRIKERNWKDYLKIKIRGRKVTINASYNEEVPLFLNLYLYAKFSYDTSSGAG